METKLVDSEVSFDLSSCLPHTDQYELISISLCMFLVNIEVSIVGTSLISITNDLGGFSQIGWVVTGYLITYTSSETHNCLLYI